jgi:hypothetical protein
MYIAVWTRRRHLAKKPGENGGVALARATVS